MLSLRQHDTPSSEFPLFGIEVSLEPNVGLSDKNSALRRICNLT
jgi:hypothetical protein